MKKLLLGFVGFIFLVIVGVIIGAATDTSNEAVGGKIHGKINLETYEKIKVGDGLTGKGGMTIDQVNKLIGKEPTDKSETQVNDTKMLTATYTTKGIIKDEFIIVTFTNDKASAKSQVGLDK